MQRKFLSGGFSRGKLSCVLAVAVFCLALVCVSAEDGNWCFGKNEDFPEPVVPEGSFGPEGSLGLRVRILEERVAEIASRMTGNVSERLRDEPLPEIVGAGPAFVPGFLGLVPGRFCPEEGVVFPPWAVGFPFGFQEPGRFLGQGGFPGFCPGMFFGVPGKPGAD